MSHLDETFFTTVGCMDGRVQEPVAKFGAERLHGLFPDTITEAGLVGVISKESVDPALMESIRKKLLISIEKHNSKGIIVHGHQECAGNPVSDETHREDILRAVEAIKNMVPEEFEVIPVFVVRNGSSWEVLSL